MGERLIFYIRLLFEQIFVLLFVFSFVAKSGFLFTLIFFLVQTKSLCDRRIQELCSTTKRFFCFLVQCRFVLSFSELNSVSSFSLVLVKNFLASKEARRQADRQTEAQIQATNITAELTKCLFLPLFFPESEEAAFTFFINFYAVFFFFLVVVIGLANLQQFASVIFFLVLLQKKKKKRTSLAFKLKR